MKIRKQNGLTLIGFAMVLSLVVFFAYVGMKIGPIYLEYHAVKSALNTLKADPGAAKLPAYLIRERIIDSLYVSYSTNTIKNNHIKIKRSDGLQVRVAYEVRKHLLGNLDVVAKFDTFVVLR
jgi:hypothetical protein